MHSLLMLAFAYKGLAAPLAQAACEEERQASASLRRAIPFKAFNPQDLSRQPWVLALQTAKEPGVDMSRYFRDLNGIESYLNELGYSVREEQTPTIVDLSPCRLQQLKQVLALKMLLAPQNFLLDPTAQPNQVDAQALSYQVEKTISLASGRLKSLAVELLPYYRFAADRNRASAGLGVKLNGTLMGKWQGEIAATHLRATAPHSGPLKADLEVTVINGRKIFTKPWEGLVSLKYKDQVVSAVSQRVPVRFALGPVPMLFMLGLSGEVGAEWSLGLEPLAVSGILTPRSDIKAFVQVASDIVLGGVGVGGQLSLAKYSLTLNGFMRYLPFPEPEINLSLRIDSRLNLLKGSLYALAYVHYPVAWPPFLKRKEWRYTLFDGAGFEHQAQLADYKARYNASGLILEDALAEQLPSHGRSEFSGQRADF